MFAFAYNNVRIPICGAVQRSHAYNNVRICIFGYIEAAFTLVLAFAFTFVLT